MNKAVFLDRDGTLVFDSGYMKNPDELRLLDGVGKGLKLLQDAGFLLILVTNQSGIARGYFTEEDLKGMHERLALLLAEHSVTIDGIYFCPHHPDEGCACRKPGTKLIDQAVVDFQIDRRQSYFLGDKETDSTAGKNAGLTSVLLGETDFLDAVHHILR